MSIGPCLCGATDCPSCGPAQGYAVVRHYNAKRRCWEYVNPKDDDEAPDEDLDADPPTPVTDS